MKIVNFIIFFVFISILVLSVVESAQVVEVATQQPVAEKTTWQKIKEIIFSPLFLGIVFFAVILILVIIGLAFLFKWLIKFLKERKNVFYLMKNERVKLAKIHRRYHSTHWWKVTKNTPIRLVRYENGRAVISKPIGHHRGDYVTHEGNVIISMNFIGRKTWLIFPMVDIIVIPDKPKLKIQKTNEKTGKKEETVILNLPRARELVQFNETDILIFAESLSKSGEFFVPVVKTKDNEIVDLSLPVYQSLEHVALGDYLYEKADLFTHLAKKAMDLNPNVRGIQKVQDSNNSIELPEGDKQ